MVIDSNIILNRFIYLKIQLFLGFNFLIIFYLVYIIYNRMNITIYIKAILKLIIEKELVNTFSTRTLFIYSSILYNGYGYIGNISNTDGYKNMISIHFEEEQDIEYYIHHISLFGLSLLNTTYNSKEIYDVIVEQSDILLEDSKYTEFKDKYSKEINQIELDIHDYYYLRDEDGWHNSNEQIVQGLTNKIPINLNGETKWDQIDLYKWTGIQGQKIIGKNWGKIPGLLNKDLIKKIEEYAESEYSSMDIEQEHYNVLNNSLILSEESKTNSEFWSNISDTLTISGFYNYLLMCYLENNYLDLLSQIKFFHILNIALFETTILVYNLKYKIEDPRPIQIIRGANLSIEINYYFGPSDTDNWFPYKNLNSGLSEFPNFPSITSALSSCGSFILSTFLTEPLEKLQIKLSDREYFLDMVVINDMPMDLMDIMIEKHSSILSPINSPSKDIKISIKNFDDLAKLIGVSGVCSGDSTSFSNQIGFNLGLAIGKLTLDFFIN